MTSGVITVFGGTGFLGGEILRALTRSGWTVRVAARHPRRPAGLSADTDGGPGGIELHTADIQQEDAVAGAVAGAEAVINAVGLYVETRNGPSFDDIHVQGARRVARCAREAGVQRLIHVSGVGAGPASPSKYVRARGRGEQRVRETFADATILRPTVLFGPGDAFLSTLDGVTRLPAVPLFGNGATRLQPVHVGDIAAAPERMIERPETAGRAFELGGAEVYSYREVVELVLEHRHRRRKLIPVPFPAWKTLARVASVLPAPPLTVDQVMLMQIDNMVGEQAGHFGDLDISPRSLRESIGDALDA